MGKSGGKRQRARRHLRQLIERQGGLCTECGLALKVDLIGYPGMHAEKPTIDHVVPLSMGGPNSIDNLEAVHQRCNGLRAARMNPPAKLCRCGRARENTTFRRCLRCRYGHKLRHAAEVSGALLGEVELLILYAQRWVPPAGSKQQRREMRSAAYYP
jgi:hypothetical protein